MMARRRRVEASILGVVEALGEEKLREYGEVKQERTLHYIRSL